MVIVIFITLVVDKQYRRWFSHDNPDRNGNVATPIVTMRIYEQQSSVPLFVTLVLVRNDSAVCWNLPVTALVNDAIFFCSNHHSNSHSWSKCFHSYYGLRHRLTKWSYLLPVPAIMAAWLDPEWGSISKSHANIKSNNVCWCWCSCHDIKTIVVP